MIRFAIIGAGYRAQYFMRVARDHSEELQVVGVLCRSMERAQKLKECIDVPCVFSEEDIDALQPDFVVVSVTKSEGYRVARHWQEKGYVVMLETPVGLTLENIEQAYRDYETIIKVNTKASAEAQAEDTGKNLGRLIVAEQYPYYPTYQKAIEISQENRLGDVLVVNLSICHEYHGFDVMRRILGEAWNSPFRMRVSKYSLPVTKTGDRFGHYTDGEIVTKQRSVVTIEYADGKVGLYDFDSDQYHSYIRHNTMKITGTRGEVVDGTLYYLDEENKPCECQYVEDFQYGRETKVEDEAGVYALLLQAAKVAAGTEEGIQWQEDNLLHGIMDAYMTVLMNSEKEEFMQVDGLPW